MKIREVHPGPCGHEASTELGWCYHALAPARTDPLGGGEGIDAYYPTGVPKSGEEVRFNAAWKRYEKAVVAFLEEGADQVVILHCAACGGAEWLLPEYAHPRRPQP